MLLCQLKRSLYFEVEVRDGVLDVRGLYITCVQSPPVVQVNLRHTAHKRT